jgi:hypothetical protein
MSIRVKLFLAPLHCLTTCFTFREDKNTEKVFFLRLKIAKSIQRDTREKTRICVRLCFFLAFRPSTSSCFLLSREILALDFVFSSTTSTKQTKIISGIWRFTGYRRDRDFFLTAESSRANAVSVATSSPSGPVRK